jgi:hypothetical protein
MQAESIKSNIATKYILLPDKMLMYFIIDILASQPSRLSNNFLKPTIPIGAAAGWGAGKGDLLVLSASTHCSYV